MIDWLFEPASNWLVILTFLLLWFTMINKDHLDRERFKYVNGVLSRIGAATKPEKDRWDGEEFY